MFSTDFKEFAELLNKHGVEYLVVGGYAVGVHGHPRYTGDIDFWIRSDRANADRLLKAVADFGLTVTNISLEELITPGKVFQLGRQPYRIDILNTIDGVEFAGCYERRAMFELEGVSIPFIGLDDLKQNKRASGRHRDLADLEVLESTIEEGE
ncbi:nucleotidyltransferase [Geobacter sp.]|uniref:nucleotidyltransferase n=1 Tax=Geobacter sp. TaxID=46610 RepID=UPI001AC4F693|nr:nucleotidyltransferase [Geobacter sp.]CAG0957834.1 hypothetical protein ANAEL_00443 [Anaerolineales bacterium]